MERIDIVACFDKGYVMPYGVMMYSACVNNPDSTIVFHLIVDESVTEQDREDLTDTVTIFSRKDITFYNVDSQRFLKLPTSRKINNINKTTYYRLVMSELLPENLHKVLYLDGDIIVRHSLLPLWHTDITGYAIAAVIDGLSGDSYTYNRLRYPPQLGYFSSGVLLINLDYWRSHQVTKDFFTLMNTHKDDIIYYDQDVLNIMFCDKKLFLPLKYNLSTTFLTNWIQLDKWDNSLIQEEALKDPTIIHFTMFNPWEYCRFSHPLKSTWFKYQHQTRWKNYPIKDKRPMLLRLRHSIADAMRKIGVWPKLPQIFNEVTPLD